MFYFLSTTINTTNTDEVNIKNAAPNSDHLKSLRYLLKINSWRLLRHKFNATRVSLGTRKVIDKNQQIIGNLSEISKISQQIMLQAIAHSIVYNLLSSGLNQLNKASFFSAENTNLEYKSKTA